MHTASPSPRPGAGTEHVRSAVSLATWDQAAAVGSPAAGGQRATRRDAYVQVAVMALIGAVLRFGLGHHLFATIVWSLAGVFLLLGTLWPAGYQPVHRFGRWLGKVVGTFLVYLLLAPFFYLFVLPVSVLLRLQGRDPLHRKMRDPRYTYWIAREPKARDENITRQFLRENRAGWKELREVDAARGAGTTAGGPA